MSHEGRFSGVGRVRPFGKEHAMSTAGGRPSEAGTQGPGYAFPRRVRTMNATQAKTKN